MLKRHFIYVRILLLTKDILFVCITLRITLPITLRRIFIALYFTCLYVLYICESNSVELQINLFIIINCVLTFPKRYINYYIIDIIRIIIIIIISHYCYSISNIITYCNRVTCIHGRHGIEVFKKQHGSYYNRVVVQYIPTLVFF